VYTLSHLILTSETHSLLTDFYPGRKRLQIRVRQGIFFCYRIFDSPPPSPSS